MNLVYILLEIVRYRWDHLDVLRRGDTIHRHADGFSERETNACRAAMTPLLRL